MLCRAGASLTVPGGQEFYFPHFFLKFRSIVLIFPQTLLIFFLILGPPGKALATPLMLCWLFLYARGCINRQLKMGLRVCDNTNGRLMYPPVAPPSTTYVNCPFVLCLRTEKIIFN